MHFLRAGIRLAQNYVVLRAGTMGHSGGLGMTRRHRRGQVGHDTLQAGLVLSFLGTGSIPPNGLAHLAIYSMC